MASLARLFACTLAGSAAGHAYLAEPPSRNVVANREQKEYCPHCLQAGGPGKVKSRGGGQWPTREAPQSHGLCGDPVQGSEAPANWRDETYLKPTPVQRTYRPGEIVEFHVSVNTHHQGHYEFRICDQGLDGQTLSSRAAGQECLNRWTLRRAPPRDSCEVNDADPDCQPLDENHPERWYLPPRGEGWQGLHKMRFQIPASLTCSHCTLQWYYSTGNTCFYDGDYFTFFNRMQDLGWPTTGWYNPSLGVCGGETGSFGEEFWNCADIAVQATGQPGQPEQPDSGTDGQQQPGSDGQPQDQQPGTDGQQPGADGQQPPSPAQEGCSALWDKCGGMGWTGPTCCQSGSRCHRQSEYYSQCVQGESEEQTPDTAAPDPIPTQAPAPSQSAQTCSELCSFQNVTLSGCGAYSSDEASCREGYIVRGAGAIPCVWKTCGCFADGEQWKDCPTLDALCTSLIQHKALRGRRSHQGRLSHGSASGLMFIEAGRTLSRMEEDLAPHEEL